MKRDLEKKLRRLEDRLFNADVIHIFFDEHWADQFPIEPGVYVLWSVRSGVPVYIGETTSLRHRMHDLKRMQNHTFRRNVRREINKGRISQQELSRIISERYRASYIEIDFGRAELEEYLILRHEGTVFNKPGKRLRNSSKYMGLTGSNRRFG